MASKKVLVGDLQRLLGISEADIKAANGNLGPKTLSDLSEYGYLNEVQILLTKKNASTSAEILAAIAAIKKNQGSSASPAPVDTASKNPFQTIKDALGVKPKAETQTTKNTTNMSQMADTPKNAQDWQKVLGYGQIGGLIGIGYAFYTKTGFLKGAGYYLLGAFAGSLAASAILNIKKK